jgi:heterodisulfide reductase subunit A-like polyferredoxin
MGSVDEKPASLEPYPPLPLDILVVGTGLAGLTVALECHRKGMRVRVLERNSTINTAGMSLRSRHEF